MFLCHSGGAVYIHLSFQWDLIPIWEYPWVWKPSQSVANSELLFHLTKYITPLETTLGSSCNWSLSLHLLIHFIRYITSYIINFTPQLFKQPFSYWKNVQLSHLSPTFIRLELTYPSISANPSLSFGLPNGGEFNGDVHPMGSLRIWKKRVSGWATHLKNTSQFGSFHRIGMNINKYLKPPPRKSPTKETQAFCAMSFFVFHWQTLHPSITFFVAFETMSNFESIFLDLFGLVRFQTKKLKQGVSTNLSPKPTFS